MDLSCFCSSTPNKVKIYELHCSFFFFFGVVVSLQCSMVVVIRQCKELEKLMQSRRKWQDSQHQNNIDCFLVTIIKLYNQSIKITSTSFFY